MSFGGYTVSGMASTVPSCEPLTERIPPSRLGGSEPPSEYSRVKRAPFASVVARRLAQPNTGLGISQIGLGRSYEGRLPRLGRPDGILLFSVAFSVFYRDCRRCGMAAFHDAL